jgi:hypothetical protein
MRPYQLAEKVVIGEDRFPQALMRGPIFNGLRHESNSCPSRNQRESEFFHKLLRATILQKSAAKIQVY